MHQPTMRVLHIMELICTTSRGLRLSDISRELGIPKTTLLPILQTLCATHYLTQNAYGQYNAGTALFSMGASFSGCFPLLKYVREQLTALVGDLGETCYFGVLDGADVLYLDKVESPQPLRMLTSTGRKLPAYATSIGKALLLQKSYETLCQMYPSGLSPITSRTITELPVLYAQLQEGLASGYAWEVEESTEHIRCFAVPITKNGVIIASISVAIPLFRYQDDEKHRYISTLQSYAYQISKVIEQTDAHFGEVF